MTPEVRCPGCGARAAGAFSVEVGELMIKDCRCTVSQDSFNAAVEEASA